MWIGERSAHVVRVHGASDEPNVDCEAAPSCIGRTEFKMNAVAIQADVFSLERPLACERNVRGTNSEVAMKCVDGPAGIANKVNSEIERIGAAGG